VDRILLNPWVSRAGNAAFIISVALLVKRQVSGWKPETLLIVVLLAAGVVLMALPYLARRRTRSGVEEATESSQPMLGTKELLEVLKKTPLSPSPSVRADDRPISVRIDREPIWHNFNYQAYIAEVHVVVKNQTDADIEIGGYAWFFESGGIANTLEIAQEVERYKRRRPQLGRHSVIEPGATESGWAVVAAAYNAGGPELPKLSVKVSGYPERFEAWR
jgi:hypothetical protein